MVTLGIQQMPATTIKWVRVKHHVQLTAESLLQLFYETEAEFDDYIETSKLGDLLKELTEACFSNRTKDPKKIIAIYCSQELYEEKKKYKNKYNKAKEVIELLNDQVEGLQNEMDVLKRNLEALRKS